MKLRQLIAYIKSDLREHGGRSALKCVYIYLFNAKFRLLLNYRLGRFFSLSSSKTLKIVAAYYKYKQITGRNCQISYHAKLGNNIMFKHPLGVVIGDDVVIGDNVRIWQQVTIGSHGKNGLGKDYPVIEDNVKIFAGAKLFGRITVGANAVIAANAVVNKSVLSNDTVAGIPAVSIKNRQ